MAENSKHRGVADSSTHSKKRKAASDDSTDSTKPSKKVKPESAEDVPAEKTGVVPQRKKGSIIFPDHPEFRPNLTPKEVLQMGSFGGTYFRPIRSGVTGQSYKDVWKELPSDWLKGLNIQHQVASSTYDPSVNRYGVKCGADLQMWEEKGWITHYDPYGWFQWYCRFYQGRRCPDDDRQIGRANRCHGKTGRWRIQLYNKILRAGAVLDDPSISPVIRQTLQHWGYKATQEDLEIQAKRAGLPIKKA